MNITSTIQDEDDTSVYHSTVVTSAANETSVATSVASSTSVHEWDIGKLLADGINLHSLI